MDLSFGLSEGLQITSKNKRRTWYGAAPVSARSRFLSGDLMDIEHTPKFKISPDAAIFTMGSCFARNVEIVLSARKMNLLLAGHGIEPKYYESYDPDTGIGGGVSDKTKDGSVAVSRAALNKYTAHSFSHELRRVILDERIENEGLIEIGPDQWFDPHASGLVHLPLDVALRNRKKLEAAATTIKKADVVFFTLGLTEGWIDLKTGLAMNRHPGVAALRKNRERYAFVDSGFQSILDEMKYCIELIREKCNPEMKFIVTVSPVPLGGTWRLEDIVVANSGSKSTLRTVAEELKRTYDFVDYFPSYEIAINSPRDRCWEEDQLHVKWVTVDHIMKIFQRSYLD